MAAMPEQRAENTLVGQAGLCGVSHWLPVKTQRGCVYRNSLSFTSTLIAQATTTHTNNHSMR